MSANASRRRFRIISIGLACCLAAATLQATPTAKVVAFPPGQGLFQNSQMVLDGGVGYVATQDADTGRAHLWSFSIASGELLDPDGLALELGIASNPTLFDGGRLALAGIWFGSGGDGVGVIDVSDPTELALLGIVLVPPIGQPLFFQSGSLVRAGGSTALIAGQNFSGGDPMLFSFDVAAMTVLDPDGVLLGGYSDPATIAGDRFVMPDLEAPGLIVVDVSDPANLGAPERIDLPAGQTLSGSNNPVAAADGSLVFMSTLQRRVFGFDLATLALTDGDGVAFGNNGLQHPGFQVEGTTVSLSGNRLAAVAGNGLSFIDVTDPSSLVLVADADFGYPQPGTQGSAYAGFGGGALFATVPTLYTAFDGGLDVRLFAFHTANGSLNPPAFPFCTGQQQANHLLVTTDDTVLAECGGTESSAVWIVSGLLPLFGDSFERGDASLWMGIP